MVNLTMRVVVKMVAKTLVLIESLNRWCRAVAGFLAVVVRPHTALVLALHLNRRPNLALVLAVEC